MTVLPLTILVLIGLLCALTACETSERREASEPVRLAANGEASTVASAPAAPEETIAHISTPVVIDGDLNKPIWKLHPPILVDHVYRKPGQHAATPPMTVQYVYDEDYLYIGYETFDTNLIAQGSGEVSGPMRNRRDGARIYNPPHKIDVVEFFIGFEDTRFMWELHHNALNQFNDVFCIVPDSSWPIAKSSAMEFGILFLRGEYLHDDGPLTVKMAVKLKPKTDGTPSTVNDESDEDTGYTAEIRIPWKSLGAPADWIKGKRFSPAGHSFRILAVCQNGDMAERYHTSGIIPQTWFHKNGAVWPRYTLEK